MRKLLSILIAFSTCVYSAESQVDLRIDTDPLHLNNKSSFNLTTTTALPDDAENHALIFTPEMSFYTNGGIDFSLTAGHRHKYKNLVIGHTVFFDRSNIEGIYLDQLGTGADLQTKRFDFRANYYHPISSSKNFVFSAIKPSKWIDAEIFFKTPHFGVGTGPLYNFTTKTFALHSRVVVPLKEITLNIGAICGGGDLAVSQALFSVSFHLFKPKRVNALTAPPCHVQKSNIYYQPTYAYDNASGGKRHLPKIKFNYNPNIVNYIQQSEEDITFPQKDKSE